MPVNQGPPSSATTLGEMHKVDARETQRLKQEANAKAAAKRTEEAQNYWLATHPGATYCPKLSEADVTRILDDKARNEANGIDPKKVAAGQGLTEFSTYYGLEDGFKPMRWDAQQQKYVAATPRYNSVDGTGMPAMLENSPAANPIEQDKLGRRLVKAGLLDEYRPGVWSAGAAAAYREAMSLANRNGGQTVDELLTTLENNPSFDAKTAVGSVRRLSNPDDIKEAVQAQSKQILGRALNENELAGFVSQYQSMQTAADQQEHDAAIQAAKGQDVTIVAAPSAAAFAARKLKQQYKGEADFHTGDAMLDNFFQMLGDKTGIGANG